MDTTYFLYADSNTDDTVCLEKLCYEYKPAQKFLSVSNGYELIEFLQNVQKGSTYPCLIILNEVMVKLDGLTTLELLKSDDIYCLIPVIMFCPSATLKSPDVFKNLGADVMTRASDEPGWKKIAKEICDYSY